jgi:hypothetical protein
MWPISCDRVAFHPTRARSFNDPIVILPRAAIAVVDPLRGVAAE